MSADDQASYYDAGGIETIDIIRAKLTPEQFEGYLLGNAIKYISRFNFKHDAPEGHRRDAEKAKLYIDWLIKAKQCGTA